MTECNPERPSPRHCPECSRRYMHAYYLAHREQHAERMRRWREAHPDYMREYHRARGR